MSGPYRGSDSAASPDTVRTPEKERELQRLKTRLAAVEQERLYPL